LIDFLMLRISGETGGKLTCRLDWLLHPYGCEARSTEQPDDDHPQHCRGRARPRQQMILKLPDKPRSEGLASVVGQIQVTWYPSGQWSTERLDPT